MLLRTFYIHKYIHRDKQAEREREPYRQEEKERARQADRLVQQFDCCLYFRCYD
jgi:hypothetical protein